LLRIYRKNVTLASFASRYKDIIISFISFILFYYYRNKSSQIFKILLIGITVNLIYQALILFLPQYTEELFSQIIYQKHFDLVLAKKLQNQLYTDGYDEASLPFIFLFSFGLGSWLNMLGIIFFALISNIRSKILMLIISLVGSLLIFRKIGKQKLFIIITSVLFIGVLVNSIMLVTLNYTYLDRVVLENESRDIKPLNFRNNQIQNAFAIAQANFLGAGLGNYYDNLSKSASTLFTITNQNQQTAYLGAQEFVHNIFGTFLAEAGFVSLILFLILLICFARADLVELKQNNYNKKAIIIAFWSLFSYGLFNPILPASYQVFFWGFRGLLLK